MLRRRFKLQVTLSPVILNIVKDTAKECNIPLSHLIEMILHKFIEDNLPDHEKLLSDYKPIDGSE